MSYSHFLAAFLGAFFAYMTVYVGLAIYRAGQKKGPTK